MSHRRQFTLVLPATLALASLLAWAIDWARRPSPTLGAVAGLAASGNFDAAEAALGSILQAYPNLDDGQLLAAQLRLDRPEPLTAVGRATRPRSGPRGAGTSGAGGPRRRPPRCDC